MDEAILIDERGDIQFVYSDALAAVFDGESLQTRRVSQVEPAGLSGVFGNQWIADMTLAGAAGVLLGPFPTRAAALAAERAWLREHKNL